MQYTDIRVNDGFSGDMHAYGVARDHDGTYVLTADGGTTTVGTVAREGSRWVGRLDQTSGAPYHGRYQPHSEAAREPIVEATLWEALGRLSLRQSQLWLTAGRWGYEGYVGLLAPTVQVYYGPGATDYRVL